MQKTATGAKDPRHLSSIAPTVAHVTDGTNVRKNRPFRAHIPAHCSMRATGLSEAGCLLMAEVAHQRYQGHRLLKGEWNELLRRMRFASHRIGEVHSLLNVYYPLPLAFDEWVDLITQLAFEHVLATKDIPLP